METQRILVMQRCPGFYHVYALALGPRKESATSQSLSLPPLSPFCFSILSLLPLPPPFPFDVIFLFFSSLSLSLPLIPQTKSKFMQSSMPRTLLNWRCVGSSISFHAFLAVFSAA